jgi:DNA-binding Lrp family transcriptional regulator
LEGELEQHLVRLVSAHGPRNLAKIARHLNVSRDTVVRAYARLNEEGIGPRPSIRVDKLGLQRFVAIVRPGKNGDSKQFPSVFSTMGDYAYLETWQKLDPSNAYLLRFTCPPEQAGQLRDFLAKMSNDGTFAVAGPVPLDWTRYHPIRAPWDPIPASPVISGPLDYVPEKDGRPRMATFDYKELLLLSALQAFPDASLVGLSQALGTWAEAGYVEVKENAMASSADWNEHLRRALRFVDSYPVHRSRGEPGITKRRKHRWASFTLLWDHLPKDDIKRAAMASTSIPYLRTDAAAEAAGIYFSTVSAPASLIPGYLSFMSRNAPEGMNVAVPSRFANYSLPFASYTPSEGRWAWKQERLETVLATLQAR